LIAEFLIIELIAGLILDKINGLENSVADIAIELDVRLISFIEEMLTDGLAFVFILVVAI
jgi:hypothetical protein